MNGKYRLRNPGERCETLRIPTVARQRPYANQEDMLATGNYSGISGRVVVTGPSVDENSLSERLMGRGARLRRFASQRIPPSPETNSPLRNPVRRYEQADPVTTNPRS